MVNCKPFAYTVSSAWICLSSSSTFSLCSLKAHSGGTGLYRGQAPSAFHALCVLVCCQLSFFCASPTCSNIYHFFCDVNIWKQDVYLVILLLLMHSMALDFRHSSLIQYLLSAYYEPGIVQGIVDTTMNKKDKNPCLHGP